MHLQPRGAAPGLRLMDAKAGPCQGLGERPRPQRNEGQLLPPAPCTSAHTRTHTRTHNWLFSKEKNLKSRLVDISGPWLKAEVLAPPKGTEEQKLPVTPLVSSPRPLGTLPPSG